MHQDEANQTIIGYTSEPRWGMCYGKVELMPHVALINLSKLIKMKDKKRCIVFIDDTIHR